jgi:hypothetical protein
MEEKDKIFNNSKPYWKQPNLHSEIEQGQNKMQGIKL